jgi:hypothetical protein
MNKDQRGNAIKRATEAELEVYSLTMYLRDLAERAKQADRYDAFLIEMEQKAEGALKLIRTVVQQFRISGTD